jgi:hypothetical protein
MGLARRGRPGAVEQVLAVGDPLDQGQQLRVDRAAGELVLGRRIDVGRVHGAHHDDLLTPGSSPLCAISRRQTRQSPNFRRTARARPQRLHRV